MPERKTVHRSFRLTSAVAESLLRRSRQVGESANRLAERYIDEGLRMDEHPLITFRDGAGGRRPAIAGTRLDVWQVIETLRNSDNSPREAAAYLEIPESAVRAAARYYAAFPEDVDAFAERMRESADREEALWRGEQALLA
jgi:uncharacterized protein (DUF433 family)